MNKELLTELFSTDADLLSKYHILAPNSAEVCAERTMNDLLSHDVKINLITKDTEVIGYYGITKDQGLSYLHGFFLTPENRSKQQINDFWTEVDSKFNTDYFIGVYSKNTRAIDFLNKKTTIKYDINGDVLFRVRR